jgi:hypothetical protein
MAVAGEVDLVVDGDHGMVVVEVVVVIRSGAGGGDDELGMCRLSFWFASSAPLYRSGFA